MFIGDITVIFNTMYKDAYTGNWVYSRAKIAQRYLSGWFWIDLFSVLPFYLVDWFIMDEAWECDINGQKDLLLADVEVAGSRVASTVKMVKLLRMVKLTRVLKASRVLQRFAQDILMTKLEMSYAVIKVLYLIVALTFLAHWQACLWALVSVYMNNQETDTWVGTFTAQQEAKGRTVTPPDIYIASLYWSMMTLTSIGYGDLVPMNSTERLLSVFFMAISGVTWTYAIGQAAGIASTLDPSRIRYETTMDSLNFYMTERKLPKEMRMTLRDYFQNSRYVHQSNDEASLISKMSPLLQGVVALAANKKWIDGVPFLRDLGETRCEREFVGELAKRLTLNAYVAQERVPLGRLYVLRSGMVVRMWRFMGAGRVWGEDFLLAPDFEMVDHAQAVALTFVEAYSLSRAHFDAAAEFYVEPIEAIRLYVKRYRLRRALINYMVVQRAHGEVKSYVARSKADGYDYLPEILDFQKKVIGVKAMQDSVTAASRPSSPASGKPKAEQKLPPGSPSQQKSPIRGKAAPMLEGEEAKIYTQAGFMPWDSGFRKKSSKKNTNGPLHFASLRDELMALSKRLDEQHAAQQSEIAALCARLKESSMQELSA